MRSRTAPQSTPQFALECAQILANKKLPEAKKRYQKSSPKNFNLKPISPPPYVGILPKSPKPPESPQPPPKPPPQPPQPFHIVRLVSHILSKLPCLALSSHDHFAVAFLSPSAAFKIALPCVSPSYLAHLATSTFLLKSRRNCLTSASCVTTHSTFDPFQKAFNF